MKGHGVEGYVYIISKDRDKQVYIWAPHANAWEQCRQTLLLKKYLELILIFE